jgi:hypothetical protein
MMQAEFRSSRIAVLRFYLDNVYALSNRLVKAVTTLSQFFFKGSISKGMFVSSITLSQQSPSFIYPRPPISISQMLIWED